MRAHALAYSGVARGAVYTRAFLMRAWHHQPDVISHGDAIVRHGAVYLRLLKGLTRRAHRIRALISRIKEKTRRVLKMWMCFCCRSGLKGWKVLERLVRETAATTATWRPTSRCNARAGTRRSSKRSSTSTNTTGETRAPGSSSAPVSRHLQVSFLLRRRQRFLFYFDF